eukprot:8041579-Pyramimonas_sp.AAC.2
MVNEKTYKFLYTFTHICSAGTHQHHEEVGDGGLAAEGGVVRGLHQAEQHLRERGAVAGGVPAEHPPAEGGARACSRSQWCEGQGYIPAV